MQTIYLEDFSRYSDDGREQITIQPDTDSFHDFRAALPFYREQLTILCFDDQVAQLCKQECIDRQDEVVHRFVQSRPYAAFFLVRSGQEIALQLEESDQALALVVVKTAFDALGSFVLELTAALRKNAYEYVYQNFKEDDYHAEGGFLTPQAALAQAQEDYPECYLHLDEVLSGMGIFRR